MWKAPGDLQSRVQQGKENDPRTEPKKDPDEAGKKHQEQEQEEDNPEEKEEGDEEVNSHKKEEGSEEDIEGEERDPEEEVKHSWKEINPKDKDDGGKEPVETDNPGDAEVCGAETETSRDLEREGEKHKAPDEERGPVKTFDDTVAMASLTRDKEGEVFGAETADLEREGENMSRQGRRLTQETKHMLRKSQPRHRRNCLKLMHLM